MGGGEACVQINFPKPSLSRNMDLKIVSSGKPTRELKKKKKNNHQPMLRIRTVEILRKKKARCVFFDKSLFHASLRLHINVRIW